MWTVVIVQDGDTARLECVTLEEAEQVKRSFINYGKCQEVRIEPAVKWAGARDRNGGL